jgi:O-antigen/teichoic acid export membrane protein
MKTYLIEGIKSFGVSNLFMILNFIGNIYIVRLLTPEIFGLYALSLALVGIVEILTTFSINTIYLQRKKSKYLFSGISVIIALILILKIAVGFIVYLLLADIYDAKIWDVFIFIFLFKLFIPINSILISILEKNLMFFKSSLIVNLANFSGLALSIYSVLYHDFGLDALVVKEVFPILAIFIFSVFFSRKLLPKFQLTSRIHIKLLFFKSLEMYSVRVSELSFSRIPVLIIENIFGPIVLGFYSQSLYLVNTLNRITNSINQQVGIVFFSNFRTDKDLKEKGATILYLIAFILGAPVAIFLYLYSHQIILFLFGEKWADSSKLLKVMSPLILILPLFTIAKSQLFGNRSNLTVAVIYIFGTAALSLSLYLFKDNGDFIYVGISTLISFVMMLIISIYSVKKAKINEK